MSGEYNRETRVHFRGGAQSHRACRAVLGIPPFSAKSPAFHTAMSCTLTTAPSTTCAVARTSSFCPWRPWAGTRQVGSRHLPVNLDDKTAENPISADQCFMPGALETPHGETGTVRHLAITDSWRDLKTTRSIDIGLADSTAGPSVGKYGSLGRLATARSPPPRRKTAAPSGCSACGTCVADEGSMLISRSQAGNSAWHATVRASTHTDSKSARGR